MKKRNSRRAEILIWQVLFFPIWYQFITWYWWGNVAFMSRSKHFQDYPAASYGLLVCIVSNRAPRQLIGTDQRIYTNAKFTFRQNYRSYEMTTLSCSYTQTQFYSNAHNAILYPCAALLLMTEKYYLFNNLQWNGVLIKFRGSNLRITQVPKVPD